MYLVQSLPQDFLIDGAARGKRSYGASARSAAKRAERKAEGRSGGAGHILKMGCGHIGGDGRLQHGAGSDGGLRADIEGRFRLAARDGHGRSKND